MRPLVLRISTAMSYRPSPWVFSGVVLGAISVFMVSISLLLFLVLHNHPDALVRHTLYVSMGATVVSMSVVIANSMMQARIVRSLLAHHKAQKDAAVTNLADRRIA